MAQITATLSAMQVNLKTLSSEEITITKINYYCWSFRRNFSHGIKAFPNKTWVQKKGSK